MDQSEIEIDNDLFGLEPLPSEADVQDMQSTVDVNPAGQNAGAQIPGGNNTVIISSIAIAALIVAIILFIIIKSILSKNTNPMAQYTKQQIKRVKQPAYVSSANKLDTPENLSDCIRSFLERTK